MLIPQMESILGLKGKDFVMLTADYIHGGIFEYREELDNIHTLSEKVVLTTQGPLGDSLMLKNMMEKNMNLYRLQNNNEQLPVSNVAYFLRNTIAAFIRSRSSPMINMLLAGFDPASGPELHYIDHLGNAKDIRYGGFGAFYNLICGLLDHSWREDLTESEAFSIFESIANELKKRVNIRYMKVVVVDSNGIRTLGKIVPKSTEPAEEDKKKSDSKELKT